MFGQVPPPAQIGQCLKERVFFYGRSSLSETLGSSYGWLFNDKNTSLPMRTGWLYFDGEKRNSNDTSLTLEFTSLSPCQLVRVAGEGEVVERQEDKLGDYRFALMIFLLYHLKSSSQQTIIRKLIEALQQIRGGRVELRPACVQEGRWEGGEVPAGERGIFWVGDQPGLHICHQQLDRKRTSNQLSSLS